MKLIVVSNRLPLTIKKGEKGFEYKQTSGGLVTGLKSIKDTIRFIWLGNISGMELDEDERERITSDCWEQFRSVPVFIDPVLNDESYNGFCNAILWPILHSFNDDLCFTHKNYEAYKRYNSVFCEELCRVVEDGDIVWIHDYHFMLLPEMLRKRTTRDIKIMFFLHVPFASAITMKALACRRDIANSLVSSDLVAFHTFDYALNFRDTCLANEVEPSAKIDAIPIGIDPELFRSTLRQEETVKKMQELREKFRGKKILLGVDRTDYVKGMPHRVKGFQRFLEKYEGHREEVVFLQVGVPSRTEVREYAAYVTKINELVSETNGKYGSVEKTYFYFLNKSVNFSELCALYAVSDVLMVTSLRDGMNLVALEYVACQDENNGVLVLSEFAGCSTTLSGALEINAWNIEEIADAIREAVTMSGEERAQRHKINRYGTDTFTSVKWAERNLDCLSKDWRGSLMRNTSTAALEHPE
jgi:trehalose 6-phosphate synthase